MMTTLHISLCSP